MKILKNLPVMGFFVVLVSCGTFENISRPIGDTGFNPLDGPGMSNRGSSGNQSLVNSNDYGFNNGEIVEVVISNTALYDKVPKAGDRYKRVLAVGDTLRVLGGEKDFIKVLTESGEVGFVSSVMVVTKGSLTDAGDLEANVTAVGAGETPIIPDIAPDITPDPRINGIDVPENETPLQVPEIKPALESDLTPVPELPEPKPVEPSVPSRPATEPEVPGLGE